MTIGLMGEATAPQDKANLSNTMDFQRGDEPHVVVFFLWDAPSREMTDFLLREEELLKILHGGSLAERLDLGQTPASRG